TPTHHSHSHFLDDPPPPVPRVAVAALVAGRVPVLRRVRGPGRDGRARVGRRPGRDHRPGHRRAQRVRGGGAGGRRLGPGPDPRPRPPPHGRPVVVLVGGRTLPARAGVP